MSFRREKGVPRGGPDGGDGGDGGNVVIKVFQGISTLIYYHYKKHFVAQDGRHGQGKDKKGKRGASITLKVPPGTLIKDEAGNILKDLKEKENFIVIARGGKGGRGNAKFKTSIHQSPREVEEGEEGEKKWLNLELKLIADVGIIGLPNAGKSTLISRISNARPKIAAYPFTTLRPHLGIVKMDDFSSFVVADLPGLIEKASEGKGLGDRFLRHIERSKILLHLVNVGDDFVKDSLKDFQIVNKELELYNPDLLKKPQLVVGNKLDLPGARVRFNKFNKEISEKFSVMGISAKTGEGIAQLISRLFTLIKEEEDRES